MQKPKFRRVRHDYPKGVIGIYDTGPNKTPDRYTVVYEPQESLGDWYWPYLGMSTAPFHPQGFGQHGELKFRYTRQSGERAIDFSELPQDCQQAVRNDLAT